MGKLEIQKPSFILNPTGWTHPVASLIYLCGSQIYRPRENMDSLLEAHRDVLKNKKPGT